jgi:hypothetical protein
VRIARSLTKWQLLSLYYPWSSLLQYDDLLTYCCRRKKLIIRIPTLIMIP